MPIVLRPVAVPDFGTPIERPAIPAATYARRCDEALARSGADWLFVYADREHSANLLHLSGFDPRFEEALLLLGPGGRRVLVTGNESLSYAVVSPLPDLEVVLAQSLSLMAQPRADKPRLESVLREAGIRSGQRIGVVGWKYLEPDEWTGEHPGYLVPHYMVTLLQRIVGGPEGLFDATAVLMHPTDGTRAVVDADQIALFEWASARASAAVWRIVQGTRPGEREIEAAARLGYAGEPLSCHTMLNSAAAPDTVVGLSSPGARVIGKGDGITTAVGYWGGLSSRAGLLDDSNDAFVDVASGYFAGLLAWYETAGIGVTGGAVFDAVTDALARAGLRSALNPGHLVSYDEWSHSPVRPGSTDSIRSGMPFQVDVIPVPMGPGQTLNCEDAVTFADGALRQELAARHPETWARVEARRGFMRDEIGLDLKESILPMSNIPLCLPPLWLASDRLLCRE